MSKCKRKIEIVNCTIPILSKRWYNLHNLKPDPVFFFSPRFSFDGCESCTREQLFLYASRDPPNSIPRFEIQVSAQNEKGINLGNPFGNQTVENEGETRLTISDRKGK